jgi:hypothetical protein
MQSASGHARALSPASEHPIAPLFAREDAVRRGPAYRFYFRRSGAEIRIRATDGKDVMDIPVEWAFGAGKQAVTFVTRVNPEWYLEHYFSYYAAGARFAPTPGQADLKPSTLPLAMGVLYQTADPQSGIAGCFECHSTGPVSFGAERKIQPTELGVHCESCHGPGEAHRDAASAGETGKSRNLIRNPRRLTAAEISRECGTCHRAPPPQGVTTDWSNAWNVRHQPIYLNQSACFLKSRGELSCLTCHDPHTDPRNGDSYYNEKCRSCHNQTRQPPARACGPECIECHMPRVSPQAYLRFTNHWIGVYAGGSKLRPAR